METQVKGHMSRVLRMVRERLALVGHVGLRYDEYLANGALGNTSHKHMETARCGILYCTIVMYYLET